MTVLNTLFGHLRKPQPANSSSFGMHIQYGEVVDGNSITDRQGDGSSAVVVGDCVG